ncbi:hypothetical protein Tdes44962_MAKER08114 [Teratosphaeria destructans]|uniref:Uncharacterized protein n=1 Tax=Teratosphaeria destructans TaxID=418781 RepID=A0A9W7W5E7_9PEZI|nr:hypothetical protein Tdes44962_MAKER08114 [Teratosphaeria destructans]
MRDPGRNLGHIDFNPGSTTFKSGCRTVGKGTGNSIAFVAKPSKDVYCDGYGYHDRYCDGDEDVSISGSNMCQDFKGIYSFEVQCECRDRKCG